jgi:hypothetical protein
MYEIVANKLILSIVIEFLISVNLHSAFRTCELCPVNQNLTSHAPGVETQWNLPVFHTSLLILD